MHQPARDVLGEYLKIKKSSTFFFSYYFWAMHSPVSDVFFSSTTLNTTGQADPVKNKHHA